MAENSECDLKCSRIGYKTGIVGVTDWTNEQDKESHQKRSDIVLAIIGGCHTDHLRKILDSGWDVNETFCVHDEGPLGYWECGPGLQVHRTPLLIAARHGWAEGIKMLLNAGASTKKPGIAETPLYLALMKHYCPVDVIELLLKYGVDPNDHDGYCIPLFKALSGTVSESQTNKNFTRIVEVLLENGADPNITYRHCPVTALGKALGALYTQTHPGWQLYVERCEANAAMFRALTHFGADVNCEEPLLHKMLGSAHREMRGISRPNRPEYPNCIFLQEHLDMYFQYGGNIHREYRDVGTCLESAVKQCCHSNSIRWLIRHGADTSTLRFSLLRILVMQPASHAADTPLILHQAGMRVTPGTHQHLINLTNELSVLGRNAIWERLKKEEIFMSFKKHIFPKYLNKQMVDLQEFSDKSLQVYPEVKHQDALDTCIKPKDFLSDQIHLVLEFLSQPQSLQWYCRRSVRENLVSLQPSLVKTLNIPSNMKRYILCHEI